MATNRSANPTCSTAGLILLLLAAPLRGGASGTDRNDPLYPDLAHWARAGVTGGIPSDVPVVGRVGVGGDLQAAVDRAASAGGGVLELEAGRHVLQETLQLRSGVVLRGAPGRSTELLLLMRGAFARERGEDGFSEWVCGLSGRDIRRAGLERLTIVFDDSLPPPPTLRTHKDAFINDPGGRDDLWVVSVRFTNSDDCWIDDSRILNSGSHPVLIEASRHVTVRGCEIAGAHNKGGRGAGYFNISRSEYTLVQDVHVRDLRHFAIQNSSEGFPCRYNVLVNSHLEVDVNFHNGDSGHNLIQDCVIAVPEWHWWHPIGAGVPGQHEPPGPGNLVFRCAISRVYPNPERNYTMAEDPAVVYRVRDHFEKDVPILSVAGPAPAGGSLYLPPEDWGR